MKMKVARIIAAIFGGAILAFIMWTIAFVTGAGFAMGVQSAGGF